MVSEVAIVSLRSNEPNALKEDDYVLDGETYSTQSSRGGKNFSNQPKWPSGEDGSTIR